MKPAAVANRNTQGWKDVPNAKYRELEKRVHAGDLGALVARWEFGRLILKERNQNGGNQLPQGRMTVLCRTFGISAPEIRNRAQFARQFPTKADVANALAEFGSWYAITQKALGDRGNVSEPDDDEALISRDLHTALGCIDRFLELLDEPNPDPQIEAKLKLVYARLKLRYGHLEREEQAQVVA